MTELLPEISLEDVKIVEEYWAVRHEYEAAFGKLDIFASATPGSLPDKTREMSAKLEERRRQQRKEKRTPELVSV
ncbi:hypothetical protein R80B4_02027 [Fibrobacteres bacterium R8-0-B4]